MKRAIEYQTMEKILKRHFKKCKGLYFDVGRERSSRHNRSGSKNSGLIYSVDKYGKKTGYFYNYICSIDLSKFNKEHPIIISVYREERERERDRKGYQEQIGNLDRLFKLLANKGAMLKELADKHFIVEKLTERYNFIEGKII